MPFEAPAEKPLYFLIVAKTIFFSKSTRCFVPSKTRVAAQIFSISNPLSFVR